MTYLITSARLFDGTELADGLYDVAFDAVGIQSVEPAGTADPQALRDAGGTVVDGAERTLLPGLIDSHVHFDDPAQVGVFARWGVTTALDMATFSPDLLAAVRAETGASVFSAGTPIISPHGNHAKIPDFPQESITEDPERARELVRERVAQGSDYIKIILEAPGRGGLEPDVARAVVDEAHAAGKLVVAHAVAVGAYRTGVEAGVDVLTHAPLDAVLPEDVIAAMVEHRLVSSPTLTMMRGTAETYAAMGMDFRYALDSVRAMHEGGVEILAGTDANTAEGVPAQVEHGVSLHEELELLHECGLSTSEALAAATSRNAAAFRLEDRGLVQPGLRADLLLVDGNPVENLRDTRNVVGVWVAGEAVALD